MTRTRSKKVRTATDGRVEVAIFDKRYRCEHYGCSKSFTRSEHLRRHQLNHQPLHNLVCRLCPTSFAREDLLKRHLKVSHGIEEYTSPRQMPRHCQRGSFDQQTYPPAAEDDSDIQPEIYHDQFTDDNPTSLFEAQMQYQAQDAAVTQLEGVSGKSDHYEFEADLGSTAFSANVCGPIWDLDPLGDMEIEWFLDNQCLPSIDSDILGPMMTEMRGTSPTLDDGRGHDRDSRATHITSVVRKPIYLQEELSKPFVAETGRVAPPDCRFRVCNALSSGKRSELISQLRTLATDVDIEEPIFSLDSMKQGVHLYCRHINIEYGIVHPEFLIPSSDESRQARLKISGIGAEPGSLLLWAVISLGWSLLRSERNEEHGVATRIQRGLRTAVLNHPRLAHDPPLWLIQSLFVVLLFARYQGDAEGDGFASVFHGVLIEATRRLDNTIQHELQLTKSPASSLNGTELEVLYDWVRWIHVESIQRIFRQVLIFDVQHAALYGGESSMTPFELNFQLPASEDAWYAGSPQEWLECCRQQRTQGSGEVSVVDLLKMLWNPRASAVANLSSSDIPRGSNIVLYGLISIARELRRRMQVGFPDTSAAGSTASSSGQRVTATPVTLGSAIIYSLRVWEPLWAELAIPRGFTAGYLWRDCICLGQLAYTLYEVSPVDLQMVAGSTIIEGKRRGAAEYARSRRKIGRWVKEDRAWLGLSRAAAVIQDRIYDMNPKVVHCHHCMWCLYLATLICWTFGFVLTGSSLSEHLVQDGRVISLDDAEMECSRYLQVATSLKPRCTRDDSLQQELGRTTGLLIVLIRFFQGQCQMGKIAECSEALSKLIRVRGDGRI